VKASVPGTGSFCGESVPPPDAGCVAGPPVGVPGALPGGRVGGVWAGFALRVGVACRRPVPAVLPGALWTGRKPRDALGSLGLRDQVVA